MMELDFNAERSFQPKWNKNLSLPEDERVTIEYANPSETMKRSLNKKPELAFNYDADGQTTGGTTIVDMDTKRYIDKINPRIKNFAYSLVEPSGGKKRIEPKLVKDLFDAPGVSGLIEEIGTHLKMVCEEKINEKNSE